MKHQILVTDLVSAVCPIDGISFGDPDNHATWEIQLREEATEGQRLAAQGVIDNIDSELTKQDARDEIERLERLYQMPKMLRVTIMEIAEKEAIAAGAAQNLTAEQSLAILRSRTDIGYHSVRTLHQQIDSIKTEAGL